MMQRSYDRSAFVLGSFREELVFLLRDVLAANHIQLSRIGDTGAALGALQNSTLGSDLAVFVLCQGIGASSVSDIRRLHKARSRSARIIVFSKDPVISGDLAIGCIKAGAGDFLVSEFQNAPEIEEHVNHVISGNSPYMQPLDLPEIALREDIFVVTPFGPEARSDVNFGIEPACKHGLGVYPMRGHVGHRTVGELSRKIPGHSGGLRYWVLRRRRGSQGNARWLSGFSAEASDERCVCACSRPGT
jgi:hypothetical protein